jgi:hypothetical protein
MNLTLVLIFGILVALFKGVITLWSIRRVGLKCLVTAIRRSLVLLFLLALVIVVAAIASVTTLPIVVLTIIRLALPTVVAITPVMLFRNTADLLLVMLLQCVAELRFCAILNLVLTFPCKGAISYLQVEDVLEVLCNRLKYLVTKGPPTFNILCTILRVARHVELHKL